VGSGAGAMTAALRAAHAGKNVLLVEKSSRYGGTSATSGGGLWIPCNHLMADVGVEDSREDALKYIHALAGREVSSENIEAYVDQGPRMLEWIENNSHVAYMAMEHYADYYQDIEGSKTGARSIDPFSYEATHLGDEFINMEESHPQTRIMGLMGYTNIEGAVLLSKAPGWFKLVLKLLLNYFSDIFWRLHSKRSRRLTMGNALIGRLRHSLMDHDVPLWLSSPAKQLIVEKAAVSGVTIEKEGKVLNIKARLGVILAAGGFEHNQELRERYLPSPTRAEWSSASPVNTGDMLLAGQDIGAAVHLMDEAWWGPSVVMQGENKSRQLFTERSMPGCIMVNRSGRRFFNESVAYTSAVQAMYKDDNLPSFAIFDSRYKREYPFGPLLPGGMHLNWMQPKKFRKNFLKVADSIEELATLLGVSTGELANTVARFNGFAECGIDEDFHRGEDVYDLIYGDVRIQPNPCLAPIIEGPFYGVEVFPGDIGTKGGLLTNANAEVVDMKGEVIKGLYAVGNTAASVTGRYYPGAGATLGPAMTFGFVAAEHAIGL
jgi:3-oxosteroid 1-dehydrogenase